MMAAVIIKRQSDNLKLADIEVPFQTYRCMLLIPVTASDKNCFGISSRIPMYRSSRQLPLMYEDGAGPIIRRIVSLDNFRDVRVVNQDVVRRAKSDTDSKYDKAVYGYIKDDYLYMTHNMPVEIDGYFREEVIECFDEDCIRTSGNCKPYLDQFWYIPEELAQAVISALIKEYMDTYKRVNEQQVIDKNPNT